MRRDPIDTGSEHRGSAPPLVRVVRALAMLALALVVAAGCSSGPLAQDPTTHHTTRILGKRVFVTVTTDAGTRLVVRRDIPIKRTATALSALQAVADVRLGPRGDVFQVNGLGGGRLTTFGPERAAWYYRVNGVESNIEPQRLRLKPGMSLWWDLRRFDIVPRIPVAIGEFPEPFMIGYRDNRRPLQITYAPGFHKEADFLYETVFQRLDPDVHPIRDEGGITNIGSNGPVPVEAVNKDRANVVIGRWEQVRLDPYIEDIGVDPQGYGLTTWIEGTHVRRQGPMDEFSKELRSAEGVVWASTIDGEPDSAFVLVVTGTTDDGVRGALHALTEGGFQYALSGAVDGDGAVID